MDIDLLGEEKKMESVDNKNVAHLLPDNQQNSDLLYETPFPNKSFNIMLVSNFFGQKLKLTFYTQRH